MDFSTGKELLALCTEKNKPISEIMLVREIAKFGVGREAVWERMRKSLAVMREGVGRSQTEQMNLLGGYIGGESKALLGRIRREGAMGGMISRASAYAMGVIELNASMGRIVAAPTAGSAGVLPGILVAADEIYDFGEEKLTQALFNAGAVGYLIDRNATLSGAEGGCQAEVGAASAMAASALCELFGGAPSVCLAAAGDDFQYSRTGLRSDRRSCRIPLPEEKRHGCGQRRDQCGNRACHKRKNVGAV